MVDVITDCNMVNFWPEHECGEESNRLLLETGDYLLLETGDDILLEV